ncbi:hypothetical protein [Mycetocola saprophilus]|uniref:hypothetical protein n=1 Tax=Mycetocola saprophilus TaxID=76636 RepID=UPI003BF43D8E
MTESTGTIWDAVRPIRNENGTYRLLVNVTVEITDPAALASAHLSDVTDEDGAVFPIGTGDAGLAAEVSAQALGMTLTGARVTGVQTMTPGGSTFAAGSR